MVSGGEWAGEGDAGAEWEGGGEEGGVGGGVVFDVVALGGEAGDAEYGAAYSVEIGRASCRERV